MAAELSHDDLRELLGAYALDAVLAEEREALEAHLQTCAGCRAEVAEHRETAALLAGTATPAPARIWNEVAAALDGPVSLDEARERRRERPVRWLAAVATAAAVAVVAVLGVSVIRQGSRLDRLSALQERQGALEAATAALVDPDRRVVELRSPDGPQTLLAVVLPDGSGYVVGHNLDPLPPDRTYQLWALVGDSQVSAAVLGADPMIASFRAPRSLHGLAVTEERAGGVGEPQGTPLVVGPVRTA